MEHLNRRVEYLFTHNGRKVFFVGTVMSFNEVSGEHDVLFDEDNSLESCELVEDDMFKSWRWVDNELVGQIIRRYVSDDGEIVGEDTGRAIKGRVVGWVSAEDNEGTPLWHIALRAADGEKLEEYLEEDDIRAAIAAAETAAAPQDVPKVSRTSALAKKRPLAADARRGKKVVKAPRPASSSSSSHHAKPSADADDANNADDAGGGDELSNGKRPRRAAAKQAMAKFEASGDEEGLDSSADEMEEEEAAPQGRRRTPAPAARRKKRPAAGSSDGDDESFDEDDDDEDDDEDDDDESYSGSDGDGDGGSRRKKAGSRAHKGGKKDKRSGAGGAADPNRGSGQLTKKEKEAEKDEWEVIQRDPPKPELKMPQEEPGYSWGRELRSKRGHLTAYDSKGNPKSSHQYSQSPYLDSPFDVTDRGVAHIVTDQAKKMESLLLEALQTKQLPPVQLQTLCSGTDAPAIALSLACKELAPRLAAASGCGALKVEHTMSCESEPFKQAYIARNFPHVVLFADVVELAEKAAAAAAAVAGKGKGKGKGASNSKGASSSKGAPDKGAPGMATTSFGGERSIPAAKEGQLSLLVAGTSCKDFSARKRATGVRKDIEDMGTSGQTFIACVDFLFAQQHDLLLLENVCGAPWEKMASYITGRVQLKAAFAKFKSAQKGGEAKKDEDEDGNAKAKKGEKIETTLEREGERLVVASVAPLHGVRLGAVLRGFRQRGSKGDVALELRTLGIKDGGSIELRALCKKLGLSLTDEESLLLFDMPCRYFAKTIKVDTKLYGLPHTRERKYLLAWKEGTYGALGEYEVGDCWEEMVKGLQTELDHPVEAFMLPDSSDRIRRFRDVLRSPIAQRLAKDEQGGDYYTTNRDADTRYNVGYRNCVHMLTQMDRNRNSVQDCTKKGANMAMDARPLTRWGPGKPPSLMSHMWMQDVVSFWSQHSLDHIDIKAVKNAESGVDMLHHNVSHERHERASPLTPLCPRASLTAPIALSRSLWPARRCYWTSRRTST